MYHTVDKYNEIVVGWSLSKRLKRAWADTLRFHNYGHVYKIQELILEQKVSKENGEPVMYISPYVVAEMLSVLCNYRLGNRPQCQQSLTDLQTLLLNNDSRCVPSDTEVVSWHLMVICQYVMKDLHGAFQSFQNFLRPKQLHRLKTITVIRMCLVLYQLTK